MSTEDFKVTIDAFSGPLDLMLHLIKEKQLDLFDLDMNVLTDQYISFINNMNEMHLEVAGEYLAEMASLLEYKSRKMIPGTKDELEVEEDAKEKLVKRLLEYQQYKEASQQLEGMLEDRSLSISRPLLKEAELWIKEPDDKSVTGSPYDLLKAMCKLRYRRQIQTPQVRSYTIKEISIEDRQLEVRARLGDLPDTFRFERLLEDCAGNAPKAIATFIAVLDLARQHVLYFTVEEDESIWFTRGEIGHE